MKIEAIYDSGAKGTIDRLTVITSDRDVMNGTVAFLGTDITGGDAFSQWGELYERDICSLSKDKTQLIFHKKTHLGRLISFYSLPHEAQKHIAERILL